MVVLDEVVELDVVEDDVVVDDEVVVVGAVVVVVLARVVEVVDDDVVVDDELEVVGTVDEGEDPSSLRRARKISTPAAMTIAAMSTTSHGDHDRPPAGGTAPPAPGYPGSPGPP